MPGGGGGAKHRQARSAQFRMRHKMYATQAESAVAEAAATTVVPAAVVAAPPMDTTPPPRTVAQPPPALHVRVLGVSIHESDVSVREKVAVKQADWATAATELIEFSDTLDPGTGKAVGPLVKEAAVLSTCNRFELYITSLKPDGQRAEDSTISWLAHRSGLDHATLRDNLFIKEGQDAVHHLLRVSAGLDSLVVGEGQILSQVNACHQVAEGEGGSGGKVISRLMKQGVTSGKRAREQTNLAKGAVSISSAAIEFAGAKALGDVGRPLDECAVVIVGAGKMARLLCVHAKSKGVKRAVVVTRSIGEGSAAAALVEEFGPDLELELRPLDQMYASLADADVAFLATAATEPIVTVEGLRGARSAAPAGSQLMLVDICVPRNMAADVEGMEDGVRAYDIDKLKEVVAANTAARQGEILKAEILLKEDLAGFQAWHTSLAAVPTIAELRKQAEKIRLRELERHRDELSLLTDKQQKGVEALTQGLVKSLMHQPMVQLNAPQSADAKQKTIGEFNSLFQLYGAAADGPEEVAPSYANDQALRLLEMYSDIACKECSGADETTLDLTMPDPSTRGLTTAAEDMRRARGRESVAELNALDTMTCSILERTSTTLALLAERKGVIAGQESRAVEDLDDPADGPRAHNLMTAPTDVRRFLRREWQAEAQTLDRISRSLAKTTLETVKQLQKRAEFVRQKELNKQQKKLKSLSAAEAAMVEQVSQSIMNSLMAGPTSHLCSPQAVDDKSETLDMFASLFNIPTTDLCALPYDDEKPRGVV